MSNSTLKPIQHVPTHIIMGFLGSGKTTAILNLFKQKPTNERWAVLVNEFGEMGIDGKIYENHGITVEEIPGGCMCCVQGAPMQVAVNRLLRNTRPDRLIIESSGVGHPSGLIKTLTSDSYKNVLDIKATIALLDPERLLDPRIINNDLFLDQLKTADILVANKIDRASDKAKQALKKLLSKYHYQAVAHTSFGKMKLEWLSFTRNNKQKETKITLITNKPEPAHWQTVHIKLSADSVMSLECMKHWVTEQPDLRIKGYLISDKGNLLLNAESGNPDFIAYAKDIEQSVIEVIGLEIDKVQLEQSILGCVL